MKIKAYGFEFEEGTPMWAVHACCYRYKKKTDDKFFHFTKGVEEIWGPHNDEAQFIWHPWAEDMLLSCLENQYVSLVGSGSSGKSAFMAVWMLFNFYADPFNTLCACTSTSIEGAKLRIWAAVLRYYNSSLPLTNANLFSGLVSHPAPKIFALINDKKAEDRGLLLVASERGSDQKASGKMRGFKVGETNINENPRRGRFFLCMDEMTDISSTVLKTAMSNLVKNPFFHAIGAANPVSFFDAFGKFSEPENGYESISVDSYKWKLKNGGEALHFDSLKHPNYLAKKDIWPLESWVTIDKAIESSDPNSLEFWRDFRGFWPPESVSNTIYTEADLLAYGAFEKEPEWADPTAVTKHAGIDPSFTKDGDRCALVIIKSGIDKVGKWRVHIDKIISIYPDANSRGVPYNEAVATKVHLVLSEEEVKSNNIAIDISGGGEPWGTVYTMISNNNEWIRVNFGGAPSDNSISLTDITKAKDRYVNRVTELWFSGKELLRNRQLSGVKPDLSFELVNRKYTTTRGGAGTKLLAEPKREMKKRISGKSPDLSDALFVAIDGMKRSLSFRVGKASNGSKSHFKNLLEKKNVTLQSRKRSGYYEANFD